MDGDRETTLGCGSGYDLATQGHSPLTHALKPMMPANITALRPLCWLGASLSIIGYGQAETGSLPAESDLSGFGGAMAVGIGQHLA